MITKTMIDVIKDNLNQNPLGDKEVRRIEGLGGTHISHSSPEEVSVEGFNFLYTLTIDGKSYNMYDK